MKTKRELTEKSYYLPSGDYNVEKAKGFFFNPQNEGNCEECPHCNDGFDINSDRKPCGQQICHVACCTRNIPL